MRCIEGSSPSPSALDGFAPHHSAQGPAPHARLAHHRQPSESDASRMGSRTRATACGRSAKRAACWIMVSTDPLLAILVVLGAVARGFIRDRALGSAGDKFL